MNKLTVQGAMKVFKSTKGYGFNTTISSKNMNGEYERMYLSVYFKKGAEPADTCDINVTNGFLTFRTGKDGDKFLGIMVLDYIPIIDEDTNGVDDSAMQEIAPLDLPF